MHLLERLKKVMRAAPRWATRLTAENILLFVGITATAWLAPYMHDGRITAAQAHHVQQVLVVTAAAMVFTFAVRTLHDIRRHRQAKELLANPQHFVAAMEDHRWAKAMYLHGFGITLAGSTTYNQLTPGEKYVLAKQFLEYLASTDARWWTPQNVRQAATERAGRTLIRALELLTVAVWILMPFKLVRTVNALREERRAAQRAHLP